LLEEGIAQGHDFVFGGVGVVVGGGGGSRWWLVMVARAGGSWWWLLLVVRGGGSWWWFVVVVVVVVVHLVVAGEAVLDIFVHGYGCGAIIKQETTLAPQEYERASVVSCCWRFLRLHREYERFISKSDDGLRQFSKSL
jgi:hypothetical protein